VLGRDDAKYNILAQWQVLEGLETTGSGSIVFEVKGVYFQVGEEMTGDSVVCAFGEVSSTDVVAPTEMNAEVHVVGSLFSGKTDEVSAVW
jgi:hypothetical protein